LQHRYRSSALLTAAALAGSSLAAGLNAGPADAASRPCANADRTPTADSVVAVRRSTLCLINAERLRRHIPRLLASSTLRVAAQRHADDMVRRGYFSHETPAGRSPADRVRRAGYVSPGAALTVGEALAWGNGDRATARQTVRRWMHSSSHRANLLSRSYRHLGVGVAIGSPGLDDGGATFAVELARRS
jgi:uncharacterized protein YkwD